MGGLLSALFGSGAIGGSSAKTDRSQELKSYGDLSNIFNWALPFGQQTAAKGQAGVATGTSDLGTSADYLKKLTSGSRPEAMQAIAPEAAAVTSAADAGKRELATSGTARGGGVVGANQDIKARTDAQIDQALFGVRPAAASELAKVGSAEGSLGLGETAEGLKSASLGEVAASNLGELASRNRTQSEDIHRKAVADITQGIDQTLSAVIGAL